MLGLLPAAQGSLTLQDPVRLVVAFVAVVDALAAFVLLRVMRWLRVTIGSVLAFFYSDS